MCLRGDRLPRVARDVWTRAEYSITTCTMVCRIHERRALRMCWPLGVPSLCALPHRCAVIHAAWRIWLIGMREGVLLGFLITDMKSGMVERRVWDAVSQREGGML